MCFLAALGFLDKLVDTVNRLCPLESRRPLSDVIISSVSDLMSPSTFMVHATEVSRQMQSCALANDSCSLAATLRAWSNSHLVPNNIIGMFRTAAYFEARIVRTVFWALKADCEDVVEYMTMKPSASVYALND